MRKLVIFAVLLAGMSLATNAQITGKYWVGTNFGFGMKDDEGQKTITYKLLPEVGFSLSNRWALGINVGYSYEEDYVETIFGNLLCEKITTGIHLAVFARFSFLQGSIGKFFLDGGIQYMWGKEKINGSKYGYNTEDQSIRYDSYRQTADTRHSAIGIRPGILINITNHIALTGRFGFLGFQHRNVDGSYDAFTYFTYFVANGITYHDYDTGKVNNTISTYGLDFDMSQFQIGINITF